MPSFVYLLPYFFLSVFLNTAQATAQANDSSLTSNTSFSMSLLEKAAKEIPDIDTFNLEELLDTQPETVVIDVRTADELVQLGGMIDSAHTHNIPRGWLEFRMPDIVPDKNTPIVVYCGRNERSPLAALTLKEMGYTNVTNYSDGFFVWRDAKMPVYSFDQTLDSFLYRLPEKVAPNVWSAIGATQPRTYANSGHNNNLSFVVTPEGVLVVNAGDNYLLAEALHNQIRAVTDKPVKYVVLENGQGHAMLGTSYWQDQGAKVIAHVDAVKEIEKHGKQVFENMRGRLRDKSLNTVLSRPDETFEDKKVIELGGTRFELLYLGPAHSPGDISVWMPNEKIMISGDIAFHQRMLPIFKYTNTANWLETWKIFESYQPEIIIPGHGDPTDLATVTRDTYDYLTYLRKEIAEVLDKGESLVEAADVDQSQFKYLHTFRELSRLNASRVFLEMEFE
jgi:glyoxylase-like metal-dependent hydrolase (beta-lactamase superfamily II)/rhodanese-related sulfurtransferase